MLVVKKWLLYIFGDTYCRYFQAASSCAANMAILVQPGMHGLK